MKRVFFVDRERRKAITDGVFYDNEYLKIFDIRANDENDQQLKDKMEEFYNDVAFHYISELPQAQNKKYYENAQVCGRCMKIYALLLVCYNKASLFKEISQQNEGNPTMSTPEISAGGQMVVEKVQKTLDQRRKQKAAPKLNYLKGVGNKSATNLD